MSIPVPGGPTPDYGDISTPPPDSNAIPPLPGDPVSRGPQPLPGDPVAGGPTPLPGDPGPDRNGPVDLSEAARELEQAIHDARVAFDCIGLEDIDRAHTSAITARTALDAAEVLLRAALHARQVIVPEF